MKKYLVIATLIIVFPTKVFSQMPLNSRKFSINNYYFPDNYGNYTEYLVHGFYQPPVGNIQGRIFFLPILHRDEQQVKYIDQNGLQFKPLGSVVAKTIRIPIKVNAELPNTSQIPAITSAIQSGVRRSIYISPMVKGLNDSFYIYPPALAMQPILIQSSDQYSLKVQEQQNLIQAYSNYRPEIVSLSEVEISVIVDNNNIASKSFSGTLMNSSGLLTNIDIVNPSLYSQNRIAQGEYDVIVSYKFRDASVSSINAQFDVQKVINHFLEEIQTSTISSSSSGWQVLGFGSRKKKLKSSLNYSLKEEYKGQNYESTTIEMFDASDSMIEEFEKDFFPEISLQKTIDNHKAAAITAASQGNNALSELHAKYASSLENNDPNLEVDMEKAAASLSAGDYVGFVAHGVRWGSNTATGNSSFKRVVNTTAEIQSKTKWTQVRTISIQHALTETVEPIQKKSHSSYLGICQAMQYTYPTYSRNYWGLIETTYHVGMMASCIAEGSPAHSAGIMPGMIISSIGGRQITTGAEFFKVFENYDPGDYISISFMDYNGMSNAERTLSVKLTAGAPKHTNN